MTEQTRQRLANAISLLSGGGWLVSLTQAATMRGRHSALITSSVPPTLHRYDGGGEPGGSDRPGWPGRAPYSRRTTRVPLTTNAATASRLMTI